MYIFLNNKTSIWPFYKKECLFPVRLIQTGSVIKKGKKIFYKNSDNQLYQYAKFNNNPIII